jgi:hypothetical protein
MPSCNVLTLGNAVYVTIRLTCTELRSAIGKRALIC